MGYLETKRSDYLYVVFRIGIGILFLMFGMMKIFGLWGMPAPVAFGTLYWFAGMSEILIALSLITGVLTRLAAFFGIIEMIVAYSIGHASVGGWNPMRNQGAPALLFMLSFFAVLAFGSRKASLEKSVFKKELF